MKVTDEMVRRGRHAYLMDGAMGLRSVPALLGAALADVPEHEPRRAKAPAASRKARALAAETKLAKVREWAADHPDGYQLAPILDGET